MSILKNSSEYNIISENEVTEILSHFDTNFIIDLVSQYLQIKESHYSQVPNIVNALEDKFKYNKTIYPFITEELDNERHNAYIGIINKLCSAHNLSFNTNMDIDYNTLYTAASGLWDFLVSNYENYIVNFFAAYIYNERHTLYNALNLEQYKKNKDTATAYSRLIMQNDPELIIISANISKVIQYMSGFDISLYNILNIVYDINRANYLSSIIFDNDGTFFRNIYCKSISENFPLYITDIRLALQRMYHISEPFSIVKDTEVIVNGQ